MSWVFLFKNTEYTLHLFKSLCLSGVFPGLPCIGFRNFFTLFLNICCNYKWGYSLSLCRGLYFETNLPHLYSSLSFFFYLSCILFKPSLYMNIHSSLLLNKWRVWPVLGRATTAGLCRWCTACLQGIQCSL